MRYLTLAEVAILHERLLAETGGAGGVRDLGALESAVAQPRMTFDGQDLYPDLVAKATALAFSLIQNHPFIDGNKRIGHAAAATFLLLNGLALDAPVDDAERTILGVASGGVSRQAFDSWLRQRTRAG